MKKLFVALALVLVAGLGGYGLMHLEKPGVSYGASTGPDQVGYNPYTWNGAGEYYYTQKMNQASTTLCSFRTPNATTTLSVLLANINKGTTTASTVYLARGVGTNATTTNYETMSVPAGAQGTVYASSTAFAQGRIVPPLTNINVGQSGGGGTFSNIGSCTLVLRGVNIGS